ncbi:SGNH/GDSL hydrolase family protein [Paenirhodobacter populi]|uniref:SGNH/GDSL hydrolase family protein n=1 Tax=Paenirhodobacter populi TaxID=2306993 RepID=A0A443IPV6_9RHOB|nr:SGNH/GDSL hydrolase family protein [Sinirhodobacter populi]RWR08132.1 SGNH/GDSL hydrolase family protein [Sinirhodobacter populi]
MAKHIILTDTTLDPADVILVRRSGLPQVVGDLAADSYTVRDTSAPVSVTVTGTAVAAPVNTTPPAISGTPAVGQTLTATEGTWSGAPVIALQWLRDGVAIAGASGLSYPLTAADAGANISVRASATNAGGAATATSAAVGPVTDVPVATPPAAFAAGDWTFATAAATGQVVLTLAAVPAGATAVDYTFDGGTTVHTLMDAGTGARYLPGLTPGSSTSLRIRARNNAGASAWATAKTANAGTLKGASATTIGTVPASSAPILRYHMASLTAADGDEVLALNDLGGTTNLSAAAGLGPKLRLDKYGRKFIRYEAEPAGFGLRNDAVVTDKGNFSVFLVGRVFAPGRGTYIALNTTGGTAGAIISTTPAQGDTFPFVRAYGTGSTTDFSGSMPVGQLVMIGVNYRSPNVAPRIYVNQSVSTSTRGVNAEVGSGIRLSVPGIDLYEAVLVNGALSNDEADAIASALCSNWGLLDMPNALVLEGDSITRGAGPDSVSEWWGRAHNQAGLADIIPANCKLFNTAISGNTIDQITAQRDLSTNWMTAAKSGARNNMVLHIGYNNIGDGIDTIKAKYVSYFTGENGVLARGLNVQVVANINNTSNHPVMLALRTWLDSTDFLNAIGAGPGQTYEGRVKVVQTYLAEEGGLRPLFVDAGGGTYYVDGVHPNSEGTRVMTTGGDTPRYGIMADVA